MSSAGVCVWIAFIFLSLEAVDGAPIAGNINDTAGIADNKQGNYSKTFLIDGVFEGDLEIPEEMIWKFYNISDDYSEDKLHLIKENRGNGNATVGGDRVERAAASEDAIGLWEDHTVHYEIASGFSEYQQALIRGAMDDWEDSTCLRFMRAQHSAVVVDLDGDIIETGVTDYL